MGQFSGLAQALNVVADRLRSQREAGEEMGRAQNILGVKGLIEGTIEPTKEGGFEVPGVGRVKSVLSSTEQLNKIKLQRETAPDYEESLKNAITAINEGRDPNAVYQIISSKYPWKSPELKRILLINEKESIADIIRAAQGE